MLELFTKTRYYMALPNKKGEAVVKLIKEPNVPTFTVIMQTKVRIFPKVPIPGRESILYTTRMIQQFHNKEAALAEYNREQARLQHSGWVKKNGRDRTLQPAN